MSCVATRSLSSAIAGYSDSATRSVLGVRREARSATGTDCPTLLVRVADSSLPVPGGSRAVTTASTPIAYHRTTEPPLRAILSAGVATGSRRLTPSPCVNRYAKAVAGPRRSPPAVSSPSVGFETDGTGSTVRPARRSATAQQPVREACTPRKRLRPF